MKKRVLLALSHTHGISELIDENLKYCGFDVINISRNDRKNDEFKYRNIFEHLKVTFQREILKDKEAKRNLQSTILLKELKKVNNDNKVDYSLFFLAQNYSSEFINYVRSITEQKMVNYQWDGLDRYPDIYKKLPLFDRTYVFDPRDLRKSEHVYPTTSFYFDFDLEPLELVYDFYFLGAHNKSRINIISKFLDFANKKNLNLNFNIVINKKDINEKKMYPSGVTFYYDEEAKDFKENLLNSRKSKVLLDFVVEDHKGLSLRTFESIGHNKKLITTNADIKYYDFYHPNNIFILDNNFEEIEHFLTLPYIEMEQEIKYKYSFSNWINYIFDIPPFYKIELPNEH